jgi:putative pyruvate formate lyase activating enzyme
MNCTLCPRKCNVDRSRNVGFCGMGNSPVIAKACLHFGEEPCISGDRGSGTVFFSGCNLGCRFCQNFNISQENFGREISVERLGAIFTELEKKGAHNINLVNPSHFILSIREALLCSNLKIPVVYNTSAYDAIIGLKLLNGLINIYLPDLKYASSDVSMKYSGASDYFEYATSSILEMHKQVGKAVFNEEGIMLQGMIIRHLILPGLTKESIKVLDWIKENLPKDTYISLMSQYTPFFKAEQNPEINRRITRKEYDKVLDHYYKLGFENGFVQERNSAGEEYIPDFNLEGI